jgi:hypothetical protein
MPEPVRWRSFFDIIIVVFAVACGSSDQTASDASLDAPVDDRCVDSCPDGKHCANGRCKSVCPRPGGVGQECGSSGSICCGLGATCLTGGSLACTDACSPFDGGCPSGFGCHIMNASSTQSYSDCREAGTGMQAASCETSAECAPGFYCIGGTTPMCVRYCIVNDAAHDCDAPATCHGFTFFDSKQYGFCF